jgi:hypothetical protein
MKIMFDIICRSIITIGLITLIILLSPLIFIWMMAMIIDSLCDGKLGVCELNERAVVKTRKWLDYKMEELDEKLKKLEDDKKNTNVTI